MGISSRSRTVLSQVVTLHYQTCAPIGSALVSRAPELGCSPATVRNVMMRLESRGYLSQPHTSAGRLPTDLGYRTYVDGIKLTSASLPEPARRQLEDQLETAPNPAGALQRIAEFTHQHTKLATFHLAFRNCGYRLGHLHLERLNPSQLLALWVGRGGQSFQCVLRLPESVIAPALLEKTENYFNNAFRGRNLIQINRQLNSLFSRQGSVWDGLLTAAVKLTQSLLEETGELEPLAFKGVSKVLEMPEFQDLDKVRTLCRMLEHQSQVKRLIQLALDAQDEWVLFFIGTEMEDPELEGLTIALGKFQNGEDWVGCVGAVGPKRMPYLHSLQIFRHAQERMRVASF